MAIIDTKLMGLAQTWGERQCWRKDRGGDDHDEDDDDDDDMAQSVGGRDGKEKKRRVGMGKS